MWGAESGQNKVVAIALFTSIEIIISTSGKFIDKNFFNIIFIKIIFDERNLNHIFKLKKSNIIFTKIIFLTFKL